MNWLRWYAGSVTDPKFQVVARKSGRSAAAVVALWAMLLERASSAADRGAIDGFDCEGADVVFGLEDGTARAILLIMADKGLVRGLALEPAANRVAAGRIAKWEARQPKREDGSADRARAWREKQKQEPNAAERIRTHPNARLEERREDDSPPTPPDGGCAAPSLPSLPVLPTREASDAADASAPAAHPSAVPDPSAAADPSAASHPRRPRVYPPAFEEIWAAVHPLMRRCGKKSAAASWDKARRSGELPPQKQVLDALAAYRAAKEAEPDPKICHLSVWFNQGRWDIGQDVEDRRLVRDREVRSASAARASAVQNRKARMDAAWAAAWDKLPEPLKARWRARVEARSPVFEAARARGKPMPELVERMARAAWRTQREETNRGLRAPDPLRQPAAASVPPERRGSAFPAEGPQKDGEAVLS